jgi:hypothetical protein
MPPELEAPATPAGAPSLDSLIAEMSDEPNDSPDVDAAGNIAATAASTEGDDPSEEPPAEADGEEPAAGAAAKIDGAALAAAVEKKDLAALLAAMGDDAANELLGGKAHKVLRLSLKEANAAKAEVEKATAALEAKYGDPIRALEAAQKGDAAGFDAFCDVLEKWSGHGWNDLMKWAAKHIGGKGEPLPKGKAQEDTSRADAEKAEQAKAMQETREWVASSIKSADPKFLEACPEATDLIIAEISNGLAKGVDSPKKAIPLVKAKLKTQYERLRGYFGDGRRSREQTPPPAARANGVAGGKTRPMTLEEMIAETKREEGIR